MSKKSIAIPILVILLILTGSLLNEASAAPAKPPIIMDGGVETAGILPPVGVDATDGTYTDQISISWDSAYGATYYKVFRNTTNDSGSSGLLNSPSSSPYSDTTASPGIPYYYWVKACNTTECSSFSSADSGYQAINAPTGVSASNGSYTDRVEITWSPSIGATYYEIWRNTSNVPGGSKLGDEPTSSPYSDTTGVPGQLYHYFVKGCVPTSCSDFSISNDGYMALTPPSGTSATNGTYTDKVVISWTAVSGATYYEVWRDFGNRAKELLPKNPTGSSYEDFSAVSGELYMYWVKACYEAGCSDFSEPVFGSRGFYKTYLPLIMKE